MLDAHHPAPAPAAGLPAPTAPVSTSILAEGDGAKKKGVEPEEDREIMKIRERHAKEKETSK